MSDVITRKLMLFFPKCECEKPIIYHLVKDFDLVVNVFRAKVTPDEEGYLVLDVTGLPASIEKGLDFIRTFRVTVNEAGKGVTWDAERCCHCGACLTHCHAGALRVADPRTREIVFDASRCIECLACIRACPFGVCASVF